MLGEFLKEDNWVERVIHKEAGEGGVGGCDSLDTSLPEPAECNCTPLTEKIWNGDAEQFKAGHALLGAFERYALGAAPQDELEVRVTENVVEAPPEK